MLRARAVDNRLFNPLTSMANTPHEAAAEVMRYAYARNAAHPGCYVLSGFVPHGELLSLVDLTNMEGLTGKALGIAIAKFLHEHDRLRVLVDQLLRHIAGDPTHGDQIMAARILEQIEADQVVGTYYRKPCTYVTAHESGLAVAIAIDDRFWTAEWDGDVGQDAELPFTMGNTNVSKYHIRQILPVDGDWFALLPEYLGKDEGYRYTLERIIAWALIEADGLVDHVAPIGCQSYPLTNDINDDISFVYGRDRCPTGQTWLEVWNDTAPAGRGGWIELPSELAAAMSR